MRIKQVIVYIAFSIVSVLTFALIICCWGTFEAISGRGLTYLWHPIFSNHHCLHVDTTIMPQVLPRTFGETLKSMFTFARGTITSAWPLQSPMTHSTCFPSLFARLYFIKRIPKLSKRDSLLPLPLGDPKRLPSKLLFLVAGSLQTRRERIPLPLSSTSCPLGPEWFPCSQVHNGSHKVNPCLLLPLASDPSPGSEGSQTQGHASHCHGLSLHTVLSCNDMTLKELDENKKLISAKDVSLHTDPQNLFL